MAGFGGSIKLTGENEYKSALKSINQSLKEVSSQMTLAKAKFDSSDKSVTALAKAQAELSKSYEKQKKDVEALRNAYNTFSEKVQAQATSHQKLVSQYEKEKAELERLEKTLGTSSKEYQDQKAKVEDLAQKVATSTKNNEENVNALSKMGTALNKAETELVKTADEMDKLGKETEETNNEIKDSTEGFTVLKGIMADLGSKAIQSALTGLKKLGSAVISVGKDAIESYANYEQLVGGVETLFKDSAKQVEGYANIAYKTAGVSANQYMETVTSFSAALLQGLGNDTKKAAEIADMAIIDMSDNANKMGTSMESIQNAYQGFAKQNYTMLDNLKLGYGGTKSEMARLVKESGILGKAGEDLTAKNLDQKVSFDQIIKAIHTVQQRMGITGTTAKEAATTIEGSVNSMKAAWQNLLTSIAKDNGDIKKSVNEFVESTITVSKNLVPRIKTVIEGIKKLINSLITEVFPKLKKEIPELAPLIDTFQWFIDNKSLVVGAVTAMIGAFAANKIITFTKGLSDTGKMIVEIAKGTAAATTATTLNTAAEAANTAGKVAATTATGALTAATNLLNAAWKANPIGIVVTALTALIGVIGIFVSKSKEAKNAQDEQNKALEESTKKVKEANAAYDDLRETQQKQVNAGMTEISHYQSLYNELQGIVDQNGKVKKGYEQRASFITSTLSNALGIEIKNVGGVIQGYDKLKSTIDDVMEKKKAQIVLDSQETLYKQAIEGQTEALKNYAAAQEQLNQKKTQSKALEDELIQKQNELAKAQEMPIGAGQKLITQLTFEIKGIQAKIKANNEQTKNVEENYNQQKDLLSKYAFDIGQYESNMAAAHAGNYEKMTNVNWELVKNYKDAGEAEKKLLQEQIKSTEANLNLLKELKKKSGSDIYNQQIKDAESQLKAQKESMKKYESATKSGLDATKVVWNNGLDQILSEITGADIKFKEDGKNNVQMYVNGVKQGEPKSKEAMAKLVSDTIKEVTKKDPEAKKAGENLIEGVNNGIKNQNKQSGVFATIRNFGNKLLANLKSSLQEKSPSKATKEMGQYLVQGLQIGIEKEEDNLFKALKKLGQGMIQSINSASDSMSEAGKKLISNFDTAVTNAIKTSESKVKGIFTTYFENLISENEKQQKKLEKQISNTSKKSTKESLKKQLETLKEQNKEIKNIYNEFGKTAITEFNKALETATSGVTSDLKTKIQDLSNAMQNEINTVNSKISSMYNKLSDYGGLFTTINDESGTRIELNDINKEIAALQRYNTQLNRLKGKISEDLMAEITSMNVEDALNYTQALLNMSDKELKAYNEDYKIKLDLANSISNRFYQKEIDNIKRNYTDKMEAEFKTAQQNIEKIGTETLKGFIKGMKSTNYTNEVKNIAQDIIKTMKKELKISSPSKVFESIGSFSGQGYLIGLEDSLKDSQDILSSLIPEGNGTLIPDTSDVREYETTTRIIEAFKNALSQMKIELDDEVAGQFVERTVTEAIYT